MRNARAQQPDLTLRSALFREMLLVSIVGRAVSRDLEKRMSLTYYRIMMYDGGPDGPDAILNKEEKSFASGRCRM
jgi:hypothetical protein